MEGRIFFFYFEKKMRGEEEKLLFTLSRLPGISHLERRRKKGVDDVRVRNTRMVHVLEGLKVKKKKKKP